MNLLSNPVAVSSSVPWMANSGTNTHARATSCRTSGLISTMHAYHTECKSDSSCMANIAYQRDMSERRWHPGTETLKHCKNQARV
eukprot:6475162-Alexandrium_andersonii.AAC.3